MERVIRKYCLLNAIKHNGKADRGAVIGYVIAENPSVKKNIKELLAKIDFAIKDVNKLGIEKQKAELEKIAPELLEKRGEQERILPQLENAKEGNVVVRIAPYPSGPLHIGNTRQVIINDEYAKMYKGKFILVMDDTIGSDEKNITLAAYDLIVEGIKWLGARVDKKIIYKSDRLETYYKYADELISKNKAYVCKCSTKKIRENRAEGNECKCRSATVEDTKKEWKKMLGGRYKEGEVSLRIKTNMQDPNPAFRDRVLFRICKRKHPRVGNKYHVWPLLEFSWAIDDHLLGITHIIRGKDLMMETDMEGYIWDIFEWKHPVVIHTGLLQIDGVKLSKSKAKAEVLSGKYFGWDDPRTWSLQSLRRRGILPEAIRKFCLDLGMNQNEIVISVESLYSENRKLIDKNANRYFLVGGPVEIKIENAPAREVRIALHPDFPARGERRFETKDRFYISKNDLDKIKDGEVNRLMECINFVRKKNRFEFLSKDYKNYKDARKRGIIMHYLQKEKDMLKFDLLMPDGSIIKGYCEEGIKKLKVGDIIQAERIGFARFDRFEKGVYKFWFSHR